MKNEKTGCYIAEKRAYIDALSGRRNEMQIELKALKRYYYSMNTSKYFNPNSYEIRRLMSHIGLLEADIVAAKELISLEKQNLKQYLDRKEDFYKKIRRNRKKVENK